MGTSTSSVMDDNDSRRSVEDSAEFIRGVFGFLTRSGQVYIAPPDSDDYKDEYMAAAYLPRIDTTPNTTTLDKSEASLTTKLACGLVHRNGRSRPSSVASMLQERERGMLGSQHFTRGDRCRVVNCYLPNKLKILANYQSKTFCGRYSQDGNSFLSACQDRMLRFYNTESSKFELMRTIPARDVGWSILDTAFSPDGNYVAYSSWSECLYLCRVHGDSENQDPLPLCPDERRFCIFSLAFSSDGCEILGGANDGFLYVYDLECHQRVLRIDGHSDDVNTVAFADATSQILYSGGDDGLCKVWDRRMLNEQNAKPVGVLAGHMDGITYVDPRGDNRHLITNSKDQTIKLWDMRVFSSKETQRLTRQAVAEQNWDYRWQNVPLKLRNSRKTLKGDTSVMTYRGHRVLHTLLRCYFSPAATTGQRYIYTGCADGRVIIYDVLTGKVVRKLSGHKACVRDVAWHPYRQEILSSSWDGSVGCWTYFGNIERSDEAYIADVDMKSSGSRGRVPVSHVRVPEGIDEQGHDEGSASHQRSSLPRRSSRIASLTQRNLHRTTDC